MTLAFILLACIAGAILSVLGAAVIALGFLAHWVERIISFAIGVLLGVAFLELLPEAFHKIEHPQALFATVLGGILLFYVFEKIALWRHAHVHGGAHEHEGHHPPHPSGLLILIGDGFHNFVDGILIAAAFLVDPVLGVLTTVAVLTHELPQEMGDFLVLLNAGYTKRRALLFNLVSGLAAIPGGLLGYFALQAVAGVTPYILAIAASSFIYIAVADLIPGTHKHVGTKASAQQLVLMAAGIILVFAVTTAMHNRENELGDLHEHGALAPPSTEPRQGLRVREPAERPSRDARIVQVYTGHGARFQRDNGAGHQRQPV